MPTKPLSHAGRLQLKKAVRQKTSERGYGWEWQQAREVFLRANPLCIECEIYGHPSEATNVDHGIPHKGKDDPLFWQDEFWRPLCAHHHSEKTVRSDGGFGRYVVK